MCSESQSGLLCEREKQEGHAQMRFKAITLKRETVLN